MPNSTGSRRRKRWKKRPSPLCRSRASTAVALQLSFAVERDGEVMRLAKGEAHRPGAEPARRCLSGRLSRGLSRAQSGASQVRKRKGRAFEGPPLPDQAGSRLREMTKTLHARCACGQGLHHLSSTVPPASSIFFLISSASALLTPSLIGLRALLRPAPWLRRQAQAGDGADFLDHLDLLAAVAGEDDVELGLLLGGFGSGAAAARGPQRRPRQRRKRPMLLRAPWRVRRLRGRSASRDRQRAWRYRPCYILRSNSLARRNARVNRWKEPSYAASLAP